MSISLLAMLMLSAGCTKEDDIDSKDDGTTQEKPAGECEWDALSLDIPFAIAAGDESPLVAKIQARSTNIVDIEQAELVLVSGVNLDSYADAILKAYNRGATISVVAPELDKLSEFLNSNNINFIAQTDESLLTYTFNNRHFVHTMDNAPLNSDPKIFNYLANSYIYWANSASAQSRGNSANLAEYANSQPISHTYNIAIEDAHLADVLWSSPDTLTKYSTVDVSYNIYPMHAFNTTMSPGDYYLVEALIIAHNGNMYNGTWTSKHGGVVAHICGFYLSNLYFDNSICDSSNNLLGNVSYPANASPHPSTTTGSTSYTSGFEWSLGGNITAGVAAGMPTVTGNIGFSVGWNNSETRSVSDVDIYQNSSNNKVSYRYQINNLPSGGGPAKGSPEPPSIARSNMDMYSTWVWYVPDAADYGTDKYKLSIYMNAEYKGYHWYSSDADFDEQGPWSAIDEGKRSIIRELAPPSRIPTGILTITNTSETRRYVDDIKIWKSGNNSDEPDYTINQTITSSVGASQTSSTEASIILPVGNYRIECVMYNKVDGGQREEVVNLKSDNDIEIKIGDTLIIEASSEFAQK